MIKQNGRILHREGKTFSRRREAVSWGAKRNNELGEALKDGTESFAVITGQAEKVKNTTLGEAITRYRDEYAANFGRTVGMDLDLLARSKLAELPLVDIASRDIVDHVKRRRSGYTVRKHGKDVHVPGVTAATASNDLTRLQTVFDAAWASFGMEAPRDELEKARSHCRKERLIGKSQDRDRTATDAEIEKLCAYFEASTRATIPMSDVIRFALYSARRQDEITQLRWADSDPDALTGIVPRLKDPGGSRRNVPFRYTQEAWDIAAKQPRGDERIFPYNSRSISAAFTRACKVLGIEDLRFHDLRHTAVTRLFLRGYEVHEVPLFSLHRSWTTLKRYTNLKPSDVQLR